MARAREVCIKVNGATYCTGSAIRDCGCREKNAAFKDLFSETPVGIDNPQQALEDLGKVLDLWARNGDFSGQVEKFYAIAAIARLILTPGVSLAGPFVIMSMDNGTASAAELE